MWLLPEIAMEAIYYKEKIAEVFPFNKDYHFLRNSGYMCLLPSIIISIVHTLMVT